jgi:hypothetical protein
MASICYARKMISGSSGFGCGVTVSISPPARTPTAESKPAPSGNQSHDFAVSAGHDLRGVPCDSRPGYQPAPRHHTRSTSRYTGLPASALDRGQLSPADLAAFLPGDPVADRLTRNGERVLRRRPDSSALDTHTTIPARWARRRRRPASRSRANGGFRGWMAYGPADGGAPTRVSAGRGTSPEPPVGIEPTTCSLRVNRSAD